MSAPLVSVIVPAYKRADTIERAVRSALTQTHTNLEVLVVDDHSLDGTGQIVDALGDPRVRLIEHEANRGGNAARRTAVQASNGEYLAFLDADDVWFPEKLTAQLDRLEQAGPAYELVFTWYESVLPDGTVMPARRTFEEGINTPALLRGNFIGTFSTVLVTRSAYERVGGPDPTMPACQDWEFYLRVNEVAGIACVPRVLVRYWRADEDPNRISANRAKVAAGHAQVYRRIAPRLSGLSVRDEVAARRNLLEIGANQGDTRQVLSVTAGIPREQWTPGAARFVGRMLARSVRKGGLAALTSIPSPRPG